MPRPRGPLERKPSTPQRRHAQPQQRQGRRSAGRPKPKPGEADAIPLADLYLPSPSIANTCTTHNQMLFWVDLFARMHRPSLGYVPYDLKTLDCPVINPDGSLRLRSDGQPETMRCVREVARHTIGDRVEWVMFSWNIGQVGIAMPSFLTLDEAMAHFNAPPSPVLLP